ncbi:MAG TPA: EscE/YscE/SsaE family type III secretion system needle protein co-chaperone [Reyranella sp.]|nr:EscE/YscE/SsaE family type III secretion system needle protein co-chaperone [Reyranella sp.]
MADGVRAALTELEERFANDKDKTELAKVIKELDGHLAQVKEALDAGIAPAEFQKLSKYRTALEEARETVSIVWAASVRL